jgi:hypothetical protein
LAGIGDCDDHVEDMFGREIHSESLPSPEGKVVGYLASRAPERMETSPGLIPAAFTSTSTSPAAGKGLPALRVVCCAAQAQKCAVAQPRACRRAT